MAVLQYCQIFKGESSSVLSWVELLTEYKEIIWIYTLKIYLFMQNRELISDIITIYLDILLLYLY